MWCNVLAAKGDGAVAVGEQLESDDQRHHCSQKAPPSVDSIAQLAYNLGTAVLPAYLSTKVHFLMRCVTAHTYFQVSAPVSGRRSQ